MDILDLCPLLLVIGLGSWIVEGKIINSSKRLIRVIIRVCVYAIAIDESKE